MDKLKKFEIILDKETGVYHAGQTVTGRVEVQLSEPKKMQRFYVKCLGKANVQWSTKYRSNRDRHDRLHYSASEVHFEEDFTLIGSESDKVTLPGGTHVFPFSFVLPVDLPSSFEGCYGSVRYTATAIIGQLLGQDETCVSFTVIRVLDLNKEPFELREPYTSEEDQDMSCCCSDDGTRSYRMSLNKRLFVPGETILISVEVCNNSSVDSKNVAVYLKQKIEFRASLGNSHRRESNWSFDEIAKVQKEGEIPANSTRSFTDLALLIPPVVPSRLDGCSIINVSYFVQLSVNSDEKVLVDIVIGTFPLREKSTVVTTQPTAPPVDESQIDIYEYDTCVVGSPSYEQCEKSRLNIREDDDSEYIPGDTTWAPKYPTYRQLSSKS